MSPVQLLKDDDSILVVDEYGADSVSMQRYPGSFSRPVERPSRLNDSVKLTLQNTILSENNYNNQKNKTGRSKI